MGKVKTVIMGDLEAEEAARKKAETKRSQKRLEKVSKEKEVVSESPTPQEVEKADEEIKEEIQEEKKVSKKKVSKAENKYTFSPGKKYLAAKAKIDKTKTYTLAEALKLVKETSYAQFDGTVELHLNVEDKGRRGTVALPHGTGKQVRVKIADDPLISSLSSGGKIDFDILVSSPEMMPKLAKIAKILGPKGLMPNPKTNTISNEPEKLAASLSQGQVQWKTEANFPIIHTILGKVSFEPKKLEENYQALLKSIGKEKVKSAFLKATMGPAIRLQV